MEHQRIFHWSFGLDSIGHWRSILFIQVSILLKLAVECSSCIVEYCRRYLGETEEIRHLTGTGNGTYFSVNSAIHGAITFKCKRGICCLVKSSFSSFLALCVIIAEAISLSCKYF